MVDEYGVDINEDLINRQIKGIYWLRCNRFDELPKREGAQINNLTGL